MDFFYDSQIRRYVLQFQRIFSEIKSQRSDGMGGDIISTIPVVRGDMSRNVASILQGGTQNATLPIPCFSVSINRLELSPSRRATPTHESSVHLTERKFNNGSYTNEPGNSVTVDRYMGVPYDLYLSVGLLTSNVETKLQVLEQVMTIFNPSLQLTQTDNYIDWTSIFEVELVGIDWSEEFGDGRTISTLDFKVPIWINPPAKIKRQSLIEQIVTNIHTTDLEESSDYVRSIVTPGDCSVEVSQTGNNTLSLNLKSNHSSFGGDWRDLLELYKLHEQDNIKISLNRGNDIESNDQVIFTFMASYNGNDMVVTVDPTTLPSTNSPNIQSIIKDVSELPTVVDDGMSFVILSDGTLDGMIINENDIITRENGSWTTSSPSNGSITYISDENTLISFNDQWEYTYLGLYSAGFWRIMGSTETMSGEDLINESRC